MSHHHSHENQSHGPGGHVHHGAANERRIAVAAVLTGAFMLAEVAGGLISSSLALLADAGHMLTDFAALSLGWFAFRLARRPGDARRTYGYDRFEVLIAFVNGLALFLIAGFIIYEAFDRLSDPGEVLGGTMLAVAIAGLMVNLLVFGILHGADRENLNIRGAILHVLGDLLGSVAAIAAALVILGTGWTPIDPILSVLVSVIILVSAWRLVRDSGHVLLEGAPAGFDAGAVGSHLRSHVDGLAGIHHVHAWSLTPARRMVTLHASITDAADPVVVTQAIKQELRSHCGIDHATVEIERGVCADAQAACDEVRHSREPASAMPGQAAHDERYGATRAIWSPA